MRMSLGGTLDRLLWRLNLGWVPEDGVLRITTLEEANDWTSIRAYPVADLATSPFAEHYSPSEAEFDSLVQLVTSVAAPTTWSDVGGPATLCHLSTAGAITCEQSREAHAEIEQLLGELRRCRNEQFPNAHVRLPADESHELASIAAIRRALATRVRLVLNDAPLANVAERLSEEFEIPVVLDAKLFEHVDRDTSLTADVDGFSLGRTLELVLRPLDMEAVLQDEVLLLTFLDVAEPRRIVRVYPVWDLIRDARIADEARAFAGFDSDPLTRLIRECITPTTLDTVGGPGEIFVYPNAGALVISQDHYVHGMIDRLLREIRAARGKLPTEEKWTRDAPQHVNRRW